MPASRPPTARRGWLPSLFALAVLLTAAAVPAAAEVRLRGLDGGELGEGDLQQGTVIVVVWASWSPRGKDLVDRLNRLEQRWRGKARVVAVNFQEDEGEVRGFLAGARLAVPIFLDRDGELSKRHHVANLPAVLLFDGGDETFRGRLGDDTDAGLQRVLP